MTTAEYIATLRVLIRADHEEYVAEIRGWADAGAARGDAGAARRYLERVDRLEALPKPWE